VIIQLLSDLHIDHHADDGRAFLESLDPSGVDVLVVAGDLHTGKFGLINSLLSLCDIYPNVLFVCGNHDYYGWEPRQVHRRLGTCHRQVPNLYWLHNDTVTLDGVRFAGTPLWFPQPSNPLVMVDRFLINDFNLIKNFEPWVYDEHYKSMKFLREEGPKADVIITHHVPSDLCASPRFKDSPLNHYFVTDMTKEIYRWQLKVWLFGHTHDRSWRRINKTLMVCNPLGYPHEEGPHIRGHYAENCLINIGKDFSGNTTTEFADDVPGEPNNDKPTKVMY